MKKISPKHLTLNSQLGYTTVLLLAAISSVQTEIKGDPNQGIYKWTTDDWGPCKELNKSLCIVTRTVQCQVKGGTTPLPPYYCKGHSKPHTFQPCSQCMEDCVLSSWEAWSECSATCSPLGVRRRVRELVRPPFSGGEECGALSEFEDCDFLEDCGNITEPVFTWKLGEWTSCRKNDSAEEDSCGLGQRTRSIVCVDEGGKEMHEGACLQNDQDDVPHTSEICSLPCNCKLSDWTDWSTCSATCQFEDEDFEGVQVRSREVLRLPDSEALPCQHIKERRICDIDVESLPECPVYDWWVQEWQECTPTDTASICGPGHESRVVYCIKVGDETLQPVDGKHCSDIDRPLSKRACYKECPVDCELGEWQNWSPCSKSCAGGFHVRVRSILVPPAHGGTECDVLYQGKPCDHIDCYWWNVGRWSRCFADVGNCGPGQWVRTIYCLDARDSEVDASKCEGVEPTGSETCNKPCPEDCVVSEWSSWSECSRSCGKQGGVQSRKREILAYGSDPDIECIPPDQLVQTQACNVFTSCNTYMWQFDAWGECQQSGDQSCGTDTGMQTRNVTCEIDTGSPADETFCESSIKPPTNQSCDIPCPINCEVTGWSSWSECNQTCGKNGFKSREMIILTLAAHGGEACPEGADDEGIITDFKLCLDLLPCYTYFWNSGVWSDCQVIANECGQGLQVRNVECKRSDGELMEPGVCLRELLEVPPHTHQPCFVPCGGDCELTEWTQFGPCRLNCGDLDHVGYCRKRSRKLAVAHSEDVVELCPDLTSGDLVQYQPCDNSNHTYSIVTGNWSGCFLRDGVHCPQGSRSRFVDCIRDDGTLVPDDLCLSFDKQLPPSFEDCFVPCPQDCQVSDWSSWSECSYLCGEGKKTRTRTIIQDPADRGRSCPHLTDQSKCVERSCDQFIWSIGQWEACMLLEQSANCGEGFMTRNVTCPAGVDLEGECEIRQRKPDERKNCSLPCAGDCVVSEWSGFDPCNADCSTGTKTRQRRIVRAKTETGAECGPLSETVDCGFEECLGYGHHVEIGDWMECVPLKGNCGKGLEQRFINCINNNTGLPMPMSNCPSVSVPTTRSCEILCPIDCEVSLFSPWGDCTHTCGESGIQMRTRTIMQESEHEGRECPISLFQIHSCNRKPCFTYSFSREPWSDCSFDSHPGCGIGRQVRRVECMRNDGRTMNWEFCLFPEDKAVRFINEVFQEINITGLDLEKERICEKPCPGDCVVSEWSAYTSCLGSCRDSSLPGHQSRSRQVIVQPSPDGKQCPELIEKKSCDAAEAVCPEFTWRSGDWNDGTTREVWCEMKGGKSLNVTGGCIEALKPSAQVDCNPACSKHGGVCIQGRCTCSDGYIGNGVVCFPDSGCRIDEHCPLLNMYCGIDHMCSCIDGYVLTEGECQELKKATPFFQRMGSPWLWLAIIVCLSAFIATLVILVYCSTRSRQRGGFRPIPSSISEQEGMSFKMKSVFS